MQDLNISVSVKVMAWCVKMKTRIEATWRRQTWQLCFWLLSNFAVFDFLSVISYIISPERFLCYYTQPEITFGYQSDGNSPALRPGIRLPKLDPLFILPRAIELIPEAAPRRRRQRRGIRSGLLVELRRRAHHPSLPSILLADVQSLDNKWDKLRARISFQRDIRDCNILGFMESCLSRDILSPSIQPTGISVHRADRNKELSRKKNGRGVCFMINYSWCDNIQQVLHSPDLEYLTSKYWLYYL